TEEGTLTIGGETRALRGTSYHDGTFGNVPFAETLREWYWGRAHLGDYSIEFFELRTLPRDGAVRQPMFIVGHGDRILVATGRNAEMRIGREQQEGGYPVPEHAAYVWSDGADQVRLDLTNTRVVGQYGPQSTASGRVASRAAASAPRPPTLH